MTAAAALAVRIIIYLVTAACSGVLALFVVADRWDLDGEGPGGSPH